MRGQDSTTGFDKECRDAMRPKRRVVEDFQEEAALPDCEAGDGRETFPVRGAR